MIGMATNQVPDPNPLYYIVPPPPGGPFTRKDIQEAIAYSLQNSANQANNQAAGDYNNKWATYRAARDNNNGNPTGTEPTPAPKVEVVRDSEGNPGWFVDLATPVVPPNIYVPPQYHQPDPIGTKILVHQAPPGDVMPAGYEYTDATGQWGPVGMTWVKIYSPTPFGTVAIYVPKS